LRRVLLADLDRVLGLAGSAPPLVEEEVDQFLASGRVSDSNLHRLLRRTQARLLPGARSESGYSVHTSRTERSSRAPRAPSVGSCQSAREPREPREKERATEVMRSVPEEEMLRWSQVAKLATKEAQLEELQKKEAKKHAQEEMRSYLLHQIDVKNSKRAKAAEDERKFHEIQEAELQRWKKDQVTQAEQRLKKVQQVIRDREAQSEEVYKRREAEREERLSEDKQQVQRATQELEREKSLMEQRKVQSRLAQSAWVQEATQKKQKGNEGRQQRIEEEKHILQEYAELLEKQEARRKANKPKIREQSPVAPTPRRRKGEELYYDEDIVMKLRKEALTREEQAEQNKQERLKMQRHQNQAFLFQQIAERDHQKRVAEEMKNRQKAAAQAAAEEYRQAERRRAQDQKARNLQNRLELEGQMRSKKMMQTLREDEMSGAEKAINRRYVMDSIHKIDEGLSPRE